MSDKKFLQEFPEMFKEVDVDESMSFFGANIFHSEGHGYNLKLCLLTRN
jgi:hypothetical protein